MDFAALHPVADGGFATVLTRLQGEVARADALGINEGAGRVAESAARAQRNVVRRTVSRYQLARLWRVGTLAAKDHPELLGLFEMPPRNAPLRIFILAAQSLLDAATQQQELFTSLGLGDKFIEQLTAAVAAFDDATAAAHSARTDRVGARVGLTDLSRSCALDVELLNTYMLEAYANDKTTLAGWASAKNMRRTATPQDGSVPSPEPTPVTVSVEAAPPPVVAALLGMPPTRGGDA